MDIFSNKIAFIGGGNMARAMIKGLLLAGAKPEQILVCTPTFVTRQGFVKDFGVNVAEKNSHAVTFADIILLAVKPDKIVEVCKELNVEMSGVGTRKTVISIAAGVKIEQLRSLLPSNVNLALAMPNTPTELGLGVIGLYGESKLDEQERSEIDELMSCLGTNIWLSEESLLASIVAASGSAPAYFYLFLEQMIRSAENLGLSKGQAEQAVMQAGLGSLKLAMCSDQTVTELRQQVTSAKGTTEQAIMVFERENLGKTVHKAMLAARNKANTAIVNLEQ